MGVVEADPFCGKLVHVRGWDPGLAVVATEVARPQVVGKDEDNVGLGCACGGHCKGSEENEAE